MDCPRCGSANPDGKSFCGDCGERLPRRCKVCGNESAPGKKFCADCGAPLAAAGSGTAARRTRVFAPAATAANTAERRQLTVMFCDLVGSTALSARIDPEDLREVIATYHGCVAEVVDHYGGFVAKYMGDGLLIYFGYPNAHEDDAERAARAGLAVSRAVGQLQTEHNVEPLKVRVGIATGLVVVGDLIGAGAAQEQAVVGETPNLAARLQALAEPGAVLICASTRRLIGSLFDYRDLDTVALKGIAEPVHATQVLRESAIESRFEALHPGRTPLVARDEELDVLVRRWSQVKGGEGRVVLISGEPGIGKSRLTVALQEAVAGEPHVHLRYFCSPHRTQTALHPIISQLEHAAGFDRSDSNETKLDKLEAMLTLSSGQVAQDAALFAELLSIPTGERYSDPALSPQRRKELLLQRLVGQISGLAERSPVLMIQEDVHWADPTSRDLLDRTIEHIRALPVLFIVTFRPEFVPPWLGQPHVTALGLSRLGPRDNAEMIARVAGGKELPAALKEQIVARTDGVPLFVEELTKSVLESGALREQEHAMCSQAHCRRSPCRRPCKPPSWRGSIGSRRCAASPRSEPPSGASSRMS
ncbi:class 3 adenylate cyclase [Bradyrhizobium sp. AZCC 1693]